jgi:hypothetical protein
MVVMLALLAYIGREISCFLYLACTSKLIFNLIYGAFFIDLLNGEVEILNVGTTF